jgi:hypothetical protein
MVIKIMIVVLLMIVFLYGLFKLLDYIVDNTF